MPERFFVHPIADFPIVTRLRLEVLQVNLGYRCNQRCVHCHVNAGPERQEVMDKSTINHVIGFLESSGVQQLDLTGGAPELNPHFRYLIRVARGMNIHVTDRCNLTVLLEPGQEELSQFLAQHQVEILASLPCYLRENVDFQRGNGVYDRSIWALKRLNQLGYGQTGSGLTLNLVYNPLGAFLPPSQKVLEEHYRSELGARYGIVFNCLYTITNMPIHRFGHSLTSKGEYESYMNLLRKSHQETNLQSIMCRTLISVDWKGYLYDCDFNQALGLPLRLGKRTRIHLSELRVEDLEGNPILCLDHCYGCTAGEGSSCTGVLNEPAKTKPMAII